MTALLWACYKGHLPLVRELVNVYKANVFQKDKVRLTHALVTVHYNLSYRTTYVHMQTNLLFWYVLHTTNNGIHLVHSKTDLGGRMSHAICMWHVHPLHMRVCFVMHTQIILQMYSWHPT